MGLKEAIILAGGKSTRLKNVINGGQKVAVRVGSRSLVEILINRLAKEKFDWVHLAMGYRAEEVKEVVSNLEVNLRINLIHEPHPLGTGGAIKNALNHISSNNVLVLNGDSLNEVNYSNILSEHKQSGADVSVLTKSVPNIARFGEVKIGKNGNITAFVEKTGLEVEGNINAGVYVLPRFLFKSFHKKVFSFEQFLTDALGAINVHAICSEGSFIDIGTPGDFKKFIMQRKENDVHK